MSGKVNAVLFLIAILIAFVVYWPGETDGTDSNADSAKHQRQMDGVRDSDRSEDEHARPARRSRATAKKAPEKIRTESGLVYQVLDEGAGEKPTIDDIVEVSYRGYLPNGTEFDSTADGETRSFPLKNVIKGWGEGLQLMRAGAKYRFIIPPELAYGDKKAGEIIGPNQTLVFEVELVEIKEPPNEK